MDVGRARLTPTGTGSAARPRSTRRTWGWTLAVPPLAFLLVFFAWPVASIIGRGLRIGGLTDVVTDARLRRIAWFTVWQAVVSTVLTVVIALPGAYVLSCYRFRGRAVIRALVTVPFVLPTVVVGAAFLRILPTSLHDSVWAILLAHVFFNYAVVVRTVGGLWERLDPRLEEAARVLGASRWRALREVTLPRLTPAIAAAASIVFLFTFTSFGVVLLLGGPRHLTLEVEIYRSTAQLLDLRTASALAVIQLVAVTAALVVYSRFEAARSVRQPLKPTVAVARRPRRATQRLLLAANLAVMAALLGVPLAALVERSFQVPGGHGFEWYRSLAHNTRNSTLFVPPAQAIWNSLRFAVVATVLAVILGGLAAAAIARRRAGAVLGTALMLPLGTSAVTVGFGFLITLDRPPLDLRTSPLLIPIAHAIVALPFVVRAAVPVLRAVDQRLREAAAVLGAPPARVWREIDLPLVARALAVGAGFAFAVSLGEFGATAFIARPSAPTLPVAIFRLLNRPGATNYGQAMAMSTILMAMTAIAVLAIERARLPATGDF